MRASEAQRPSPLARLWRVAATSASQARRPFGRTLQERALTLSAVSTRVLGDFGFAIATSGTRPRGPCVLVSNHLSWFDPLVVAAQVPLTAIAKSEVAQWPIIGERAAALGVIFVDRASGSSGVRALLAARRALREGLCVLNFPEGTTTRGEQVLPFRRGIFGLARLLGVPVIPVRLEVAPWLTWVGDDPLVPHLWRVAASERAQVAVHFDAPTTPLPCELDGAWAERVRRRIAQPLDTAGVSDAALCA